MNTLAADFPWIDFNRVLATVVIVQIKMLPRYLHQLGHLCMADKSGRTATPVQLIDLARAIKQLAL